MLGGLAALPTLGMPALASSEPDAAFLTVAQRILPMLDHCDELWSLTGPLWEMGNEEVLLLLRDGMSRQEAEAESTAWQRYKDAYKPANEMANAIEDIVAPFMDVPVSTLRGLLLKTRIGMSLTHFAEDAPGDLLKMVESGALSA